MVEIIYHVYFPKFTQFDDLELKKIKDINHFLAFNVTRKMREGTLFDLRLKMHREISLSRQINYKNHREVKSKTNFDFEKIQTECCLEIGQKYLVFELSGSNVNNLCCQIIISIFESENKDNIKKSNIQLTHLIKIIRFVFDIEFFAKFDGNSTDEEIDDIYSISLHNYKRSKFLNAEISPRKKAEDINKKISVKFQLYPHLFDTESDYIELEGNLESSEIIEFTSQICNFLGLICQ